MSNVINPRNVKMHTYMARAEFRIGWDDYMTSRPMRDESSWKGGGYGLSPVNQQCSYERGRHFAAWCKSLGYIQHFKDGRSVATWALDEMREGRRIGVLI